MRNQRSEWPKWAVDLAGLTFCVAVAIGIAGRAGGQVMKGVVAAAPATPNPVATQAAEAPGVAPDPSAPTLHLTNGGFVSGKLEDSDQAGRFRWLGSAFTTPFDFLLNDVNGIHFPAPAKLPEPSGDYCFELAGGDVIFGSILSLDDKVAELEAPPLGRLHIQRSSIERIYRWRDSADLIYLGPNGLAGWTETSAKKGWAEESGQLVCNQAGAEIRGNFKIPARAAIEFDLAWKAKPDFELALGVGDDPKSTASAFRFEAWDGDLVVQRETEKDADVASIMTIGNGAGRAHFQVFLDQEKGRILVFSTNGRRLADLTVTDRKAQVLGGVRLLNKRGELKLELLRISRWKGEAPREADVNRSRVHLVDGSIVYGQVSHFDSAAKAFVMVEDKTDDKDQKDKPKGETRIPVDRISSVYLALSKEKPQRGVRVQSLDGTRVSGELLKVQNGKVQVSVPDIKETLNVPVADLRSVMVLSHSASPSTAGRDPLGTLELHGIKLTGWLVGGREQAGASCLAWQPRGSDLSSPLRPGVSGRIVYREPPPPVPANRQQPVQQAPVVRFAGPFRLFLGNNQASGASDSRRRALYLRTGDVVPCEVTKIDEQGVWFKSKMSEKTFVTHDKVKAVELAFESSDSIRVGKSTKRERLLTLPRMQKDSPPTQMIRSTNGDYLRGRVLSLDDKTLKVEVRLESKKLPRDRISRIIWLHPDETDPSKEKPRPPDQKSATRVQALRSDGIRLTFHPQQVADSSISGTSEVLGACKVPVKDVDVILIGDAIEKAAAQLAYQQWKMKNAQEPIVSQTNPDGSPGGESAGTESALVGKPAPDFSLELLDGSQFQLAKLKGKVVVLDFWATWCGPCLQAMPQVDKVTREFKDRDVRLIAVNLQESPKQIKEMLERHKLEMTVALDRDGEVAERYSANAIPQTVIIDREGKIARLFIGGGPHLGDQLRQSLESVLKGDKPVEVKK